MANSNNIALSEIAPKGLFLIDSLNDAVICTNKEGICLYGNKAAQKMLQTTADNIAGKSIEDILVFYDDKGVIISRSEHPVRQAILTGQDSEGEDMVSTPERLSDIKYTVRCTSVMDAITGAIVICTDISAVRRRERELLRINNNLENLLNATGHLIWSVSTAYQLISCNQPFINHMLATTGKDVAQGDHMIMNVFGVGMQDRWKGYYDRALNGEFFTVKEQVYNAGKDDMDYIEVSFTPLNSGDKGNISGVGCFSKNVTEETLQQKVIIETNIELENIFNQSIDIICTIDEEGNLLKVSDAAKKILGYDTDELTGVPYIDIVCSDNRASTLHTIQEIRNGKEITSFENWCTCKNGLIISIVWSAKWDKTSNVMYCIGRDVTEKQSAELKLKLSEQRYRSLVQESGDMIAIFDVNANYTYLSPSTEKMLGISAEHFLGKQAFNFICLDDRKNVVSSFNQLKNEHQVKVAPFRTRHADGNWRWLEATFTDMTNDPSVNGIVVNARDVTYKFLAEKKIRESEALLAEAQQLIKMGSWNFDLATDTLTWSDEVYNVFGTDSTTFKQNYDSFIALIDEEDRELVSRTIDQSRKTGEPFSIEYRTTLPTGEQRIIEGHGYGEKDAKGKVIRLFGTSQNITERKHADEKLKEINQRYEYVTKATSDAIWDWDIASNETYLGQGFSDIFGEMDFAGLSIREKVLKRIHPDDIQSLLKNTELSLKSKNTNWQYEHRYLKADMTYAYVLNKALIVRDERGRAVRVIGAMQDITSDKKKEEHRKLLESVITHANDAVVITEAEPIDENGPRIIYVNEAFTRMTGYEPEDVIGLTPRILQGAKTDKDQMRQLKASMKKWQAHELTTINYKKNGEEFWVNFSVCPVQNESGRYTHWIAIERDITKQKIAEINLRKLNDNLREHARQLANSNSELEQFAFVASHDLQEPLRMVTSFLSQLEKKYKDIIDDKGKQYIHFASDGAMRMKQIILDLLEYSRAGRTDDNQKEESLDQLLHDILLLYKQKIDETHAKIIVDPMPSLFTHKALLRPVFQNLIGNSLKYHSRINKPLIHISCSDNGDHWQFSVKDNGIGIEPEYHDKIFIVFKRLHTNTEYSGTGIGLAITKKIIEGMGGRIWVESTPGSGSTFFFTIIKNNKI